MRKMNSHSSSCSITRSFTCRIQRQHQLQFFNSKRLIHHGFRFDRIPDYKPPQSLPFTELDDVSRTSIKTLPFPKGVKDKLFTLIKSVGKKQDIDRCGTYISRRLAARNCAEVPCVLPSVLLDQDGANKKHTEEAIKLSKDPRFSHLAALLKENKLGPNEQAQIELTLAEDARHKKSKIEYSPQIAIAHTAHYFFGHYAVFLRIYNEIKRRAINSKCTSMLFYNAGSGASVIAANEIWGLHNLNKVLAVEPRQHLMQISQYLCSGNFNEANEWQGDIYANSDKYSVITLPYYLTNVSGFKSRSLLIKHLWNQLEVGGIMVIVETGTPTGFRMIHSARELFISQLPEGHFHFVAPCPHEGLCPMALTGKDWCHFAQRIYRIPHYIYSKGPMRVSIDTDKFSYLAIAKGPGPRHKYKTEYYAPTAAEKSYFWPRIVLPTLKPGRRVLIDVCSAPGNFKRLIVPKNTPEMAGYRHARDAMWGDLWRFTSKEEKPIARGYVPQHVKAHLLHDVNTGHQEQQHGADMIRHYGS